LKQRVQQLLLERSTHALHYILIGIAPALLLRRYLISTVLKVLIIVFIERKLPTHILSLHRPGAMPPKRKLPESDDDSDCMPGGSSMLTQQPKDSVPDVPVKTSSPSPVDVSDNSLRAVADEAGTSVDDVIERLAGVGFDGSTDLRADEAAFEQAAMGMVVMAALEAADDGDDEAADACKPKGRQDKQAGGSSAKQRWAEVDVSEEVKKTSADRQHKVLLEGLC
jgi:hypothetical protein